MRRTAAFAASGEIKGTDVAYEQGTCLSQIIWNGLESCQADQRATNEPGRPSRRATFPPAPAPFSARHRRVQDGAGTGGLESEHGEAEKANGPNQAFSKETLIQAMEKTGWVQVKAALHAWGNGASVGLCTYYKEWDRDQASLTSAGPARQQPALSVIGSGFAKSGHIRFVAFVRSHGSSARGKRRRRCTATGMRYEVTAIFGQAVRLERV